MIDISEFYPIKLSPGFITIAFHIGCIGCNFCSVRYANSRDEIFAGKINEKYPCSPRELYNLLLEMPAFFESRTPIRIGNDTDFKFEERQVEEFVNLLPSDYPIIVLTRFPVSESVKHLFQRRNVLLKITMTPKSEYLDCPYNADEILGSLDGITSETMITIGPIDRYNSKEAKYFIDKVPKKKNFSLYIKPLNQEFHSSLKYIPMPSGSYIEGLKKKVEEAGFRHLSQLTCPLSNNLGFAHKRVSDVPPEEKKFCDSCTAYNDCYSKESLAENDLYGLLIKLNLRLTEKPIRKGFKSYLISVDKPTAFGDELYLSETLKYKIKIKQTNLGTGGYNYSASYEVMERWESCSFFSYNSMRNKFDEFIYRCHEKAKDNIARENTINRLDSCKA